MCLRGHCSPSQGALDDVSDPGRRSSFRFSPRRTHCGIMPRFRRAKPTAGLAVVASPLSGLEAGHENSDSGWSGVAGGSGRGRCDARAGYLRPIRRCSPAGRRGSERDPAVGLRTQRPPTRRCRGARPRRSGHRAWLGCVDTAPRYQHQQWAARLAPERPSTQAGAGGERWRHGGSGVRLLPSAEWSG